MMFKDLVNDTVFEKSFPRLVGSDDKSILNKYPMLNEKYLIISPSNLHQKKNKINYRAWQNDKWKELIEALAKNI